jgi:hypothetical protein
MFACRRASIANPSLKFYEALILTHILAVSEFGAPGQGDGKTICSAFLILFLFFFFLLRLSVFLCS